MKPRHDDGQGWKRGEGVYSKSGDVNYGGQELSARTGRDGGVNGRTGTLPKRAGGKQGYQNHFIGYNDQAAAALTYQGSNGKLTNGKFIGKGNYAKNYGIDGGGKNTKRWGLDPNPGGLLAKPIEHEPMASGKSWMPSVGSPNKKEFRPGQGIDAACDHHAPAVAGEGIFKDWGPKTTKVRAKDGVDPQSYYGYKSGGRNSAKWSQGR